MVQCQPVSHTAAKCILLRQSDSFLDRQITKPSGCVWNWGTPLKGYYFNGENEQPLFQRRSEVVIHLAIDSPHYIPILSKILPVI